MLCRPYILLGCLVSLLLQQTLAQEGTLSCQLVACIPDSGDILIGRGDSVSINSTCGMAEAENYIATCTEGPPRPCSFVCNANDSSTSHPPENIALPYSSADVNKTWWQSSIGDEVVSIEVNLKALFHFTHFVMTFRSPRPLSLIVEKSRDFGKTYSVYQYFADDCLSRFGMESRVRLIDINDVICSESYLEERSNEIVYRVLPPYLHITELYTPQVTEKITITNLRITMARHDLSSIPANAELALYQYFAVYSLVLRGWCFCYGHASECDPIEGVPQQPGMVNPICRCIHNTRGSNCEECLPLYNDRPWKAAAPNGEANACKRCQCYGHADSCHYDEEISGGVCDNCTHNTAGIHCEQCQPFFYRNTTTLRNDPEVCLECACDPAGSRMKGECIRDDDNLRSLRSGQCLCKANVEASDPYTTLCDTCLPGYFNLSADNPNGCEACNCNSAGSLGEECDQKSGQCRCKSGVTGLKCDQCKVERCCLSSSDPEGCRPCNCDVGGSYDLMCDVDTGQCPCRENIEGLKCDILPNGTFVDVVVTIEIEDIVTNNKTKIINVGDKMGPFVVEVTPNTTIDVPVDPEITTGNKITITFGIPNNTDVTDVNFNITINATNPVDPGEFPGGPCRDGAISTTSSTTSFTVSGRDAVFNPRTGLYTLELDYVCLEKDTNYTISIDYTPTDKNTTVYLDKIDIIPDVRVFNFTPPTVDVDCSVPLPPVVCEVYTMNVTVNNTITVPCDDPIAVEDLITDPSCSIITKVVIILKNGSNPCNCDAHGSLNDLCETIGGQCDCRPGFGGRKCDKCLPHFKRTSLEMCTECSCDTQGSLHESCNVNTGQCVCLPGVTGLTCDRCLDGHYDFGNPEGCTPCKCDGVGSSSVDCDGNGTCSCHPGVVGDKCDRCAPDHYGFSPSGCQPCDCDADGSLFTGSCDSISGQCTCRVGVSGRRCDQCESSPLGPSRTIDGYCIGCFCNGFSNDCGRDDGWYQAKVSYAFTEEDESQNWTSNSQVTWRGGYLEFSTDFSTNDTTLEVLFPPDAIGNKRTAYGHFLVMTLQLNQSKGTPLENTPLFVIETRLNQYSNLRLEAALNPFSDGLQSVVIPLVASSFQRVTFLSFPASENDLRKVLADITSMKLVVKFSADSVARQPTLDLHSVHFNYAVDDPTHSHALVPPTTVQFVERCECPVSRHGEVCQFCSEGYTRDPPSGGQFAKCVKCFCFGHADSCHPETGVCINCTGNTAGDHCESCRTGYYRNFTSNTCEECKCFGGPGELNQFTQECSTNSRDQVICNCPEGFLQPDCGRCAPGFYGDPTKPDGNCRLCECNNNSVTTGPQCDSVRGVCNCIDPYTGDSCERCKDGYHGDAVIQMCSVCDCDDVGTESGTDCSHLTGQCMCRENTTGLRCDRCEPETYGLRTLGACVGCGCCVAGSASANCTQDLGRCNCLPGYTGPKCCDCADGYHDNGEGRCIECNCPVDVGAAMSNVCDKSSGQCPCKEGVTGLKCESCLSNTSGLLPLCEPCDECYDRWFDRISVFLSDVRVAISIAESLNITITPVEDLFQLIRDINDTINLSRIEPEVYNTTNENIHNLILFVRDLLDRGGEYRQRLEEASELDAELWNSTLDLNMTLQSLVSQAAQLNQSYPILDCEPFRLLVESGHERSNLADRLVVNDVVNLTANITVYLQDYKTKREERNFEVIEGRLGDMIITVQDLLRDYNYLLDNVTVSLCGGSLTEECSPCGGSSCGFCSVAVECGGLFANASLALESATSARILGEFLQQNLSSSIRVLQALGMEINTLLEVVTMTGSFVTESRERVNATHTLVLAVLGVLNETSIYLKEATPEMIAILEEETLSYKLTRTPEQVLDLLSELRETLNAFPPWVDANNTMLTITAETLWRNAVRANELALDATTRAKTVRKELIKYRRDAQHISYAFRLTDGNMTDSRMQSTESSSLLTNIEGNLNETEALLDHLEGFLVDVRKRFAENEDRLRVVQATTDRTEELAEKTKMSTDVLDEKVESLKASASDSATTTNMDRNETTLLRIRMEEVNKKSLRQLTEVEDMLRRQNHLRQRQKQVKDDIVHIKIELEDISKDISKNTFKNTGCQRIGGAG